MMGLGRPCPYFFFIFKKKYFMIKQIKFTFSGKGANPCVMAARLGAQVSMVGKVV